MGRCRTAFNAYSVKFSPFFEGRIAVATAQNFGIIGNGKQHVFEVGGSGGSNGDGGAGRGGERRGKVGKAGECGHIPLRRRALHGSWLPKRKPRTGWHAVHTLRGQPPAIPHFQALASRPTRLPPPAPFITFPSHPILPLPPPA